MSRLTLFHCTNTLAELTNPVTDITEFRAIELPCSSMIKDFIILRAFETGSDAVIVLTCPKSQCQHTDGNTRAWRRVERVRKILDSIGLDRQRLLFFDTVPKGDGITEMINQALSEVKDLGSSPITDSGNSTGHVTRGVGQ